MIFGLPIDWTKILEVAIAALSGGALYAFLNYLLSNRKQNASEFIQVVNEYKELVRRANIRVEALTQRIEKLEHQSKEDQIEIHMLQNKLLIFEGSHTDIPLPTWLKDTSGKMLFLNTQYEEFYLLTRGYVMDDYIGNDDHAVWDDQTAIAFRKHDNRVMRSKQSIRFIEQVVINEVQYWIEVLKWPRKLKEKVIGIGGMELRRSTQEIFLDR